MPKLTEEEYDALDELLTKTTPKVTGNGKSGFFMKHKGNIIVVNDVSAAYLRSRADAVHKTPSEIIDEMVLEQMKVAQG
jgi:hypothetical protein